MKPKTLYLTSGDSEMFKVVRRIERFHWDSVNEQSYLIVETDIPVDLSSYGFTCLPIATFYLLNRFVEEEEAFRTLSSFPIYVHVMVPKSSNAEIASSRADFFNIAWATLYNNLTAAEQKSW